MSHPLNWIIDGYLKTAEENGAFDNLPGAGKPLPKREDPRDALLSHVSREHKIKPPIVVMREQIVASQARLKDLSDPDARKAEMKVLADLQMRLAMELEAFRRFG
ncbi:DnaJ family domain-containing protein [Pseudooceanicola sp. LIPI14-2-Ac024]|uniref:DnaJ family domain-containing protein n=1 Tax=Pseudooceanicola sp. LIPI14-2-Ac024 TaxID=3344875 RepID=UPI0035CEFA27